MTDYTKHIRIQDEDLNIELAKQMSLDIFYSFFIKRNVEDVIRNLDEKVYWTGSKEYFVCHCKSEAENLINKELEVIPASCVLKVIRLEGTKVVDHCYDVSGELEIRLPYQVKIIYTTLKFMATVVEKEDGFHVRNLQSFMHGPEMSGYAFADNEEGAKNLVEDMNQQNHHDPLTGLYTLDYFKDTLQMYLKQSSPTSEFALLYTDITNFEKLNNLYGLQHADQVLVELSSLLTSFNKDVIYCCRSVADHFLLLMEIKDENQVRREVNKVCQSFDQEIAVNFPDALLKMGIGVYIITDRELTVDKMVEHANVARKSLRFPSSNRVAFYDASVFTQVEKVKRIEKKMEKALYDREFQVYLQPKYDLITERIVGAEALIRWLRPDKSMVYPDEFIPVFEKNGFIQKIDFYVLDEICATIRRRLDEGRKCVPISVNQSRYLLKSNSYTDRIAGTLKKNNTPPELIELELTERLFSDKLGDMAMMMEELKQIGIRWSIDDFGTGYSSLNLLKSLPVDIIKIDKAFLDETESSEPSRIIIRKIIELTRELDKTVVCEGVETETQADFLRNIGCDVAQGFLYARPMPMEEFEQLLDEDCAKDSV